MNLFLLGSFVLLLAISIIEAKERCCKDLPCFTNEFPYGHLPLPQCPEDIKMELRLNTRTNPDTHELMTKYHIPSVFHRKKRVIILIHGWMGFMYTGWLADYKDAILKEEDANVIAVKWASTDLIYPRSVANTRTIGAELHAVIQNLKKVHKIKEKNVYCIGHSLGAHSCAMLGKRSKIGRISGLDPAGPLFQGYNPMSHLNTNDADLVDVYHTNIKSYTPKVAPGFKDPIGHIDFYPNKGTKMPGCLIDPLSSNIDLKSNRQSPYGIFPDFTLACSHNRAVEYFKESINAETCIFRVTQICTDRKKLPGSCAKCTDDPNKPCQAMGFNADKYSGRGIFYLETNRKSPFCIS